MAREQFQTLSEPMYYILLALSKELCGVEIMKEVEIISSGRLKIGPGTLYTLLKRFEENKYINQISHEKNRRTYVISDIGKEFLMLEYQRIKILSDDGKKCMEEIL